LFNPTPDRLLRDLTTDRPDVTESPFTVDAGRIQAETNLFGYARSRPIGCATSQGRLQICRTMPVVRWLKLPGTAESEVVGNERYISHVRAQRPEPAALMMIHIRSFGHRRTVVRTVRTMASVSSTVPGCHNITTAIQIRPDAASAAALVCFVVRATGDFGAGA
jgi:hypothetical protein